MFENKKIHFIGIGGISMSGIAEILHEKGAIITGSDMQEGKTINKLKEKGFEITIGENPNLIDNSDIVVYTAAISDDNKEMVRAKELNKPLYERAVFLGMLTKEYKNVICISGTHGKSTTTGMIASCFLDDGLNPTIQIGAYLPKIKANYHVGGNDFFIMEACEYVDSFLNFFPTSEVILNIDDDHLDYFGNIDNIKKSFAKYINLLPANGNLIINADDKNISDLRIPENIKIIRYGIENNAEITAKNISYNELGNPQFDVYYENKLFTSINLRVMGIHNIYNALAAIAMGIVYGLKKESIKKALEEYIGVERRFELVGTFKGNVLVYDDYAHHPTEIEATLNSVKNIKCNKNIAVFQSHTYSRTKEHLEEFANVLKEFDNVIIAPIYPAREKNIYNIKETDITELIKPYNSNVWYIDSFDKIVEFLKANAEPNDLIITIGAGPVNEVGLKLLGKK